MQTRSERFKSTNTSDFPTVTGREIEWKFSPIAKLRPLIEGVLDGGAWHYDTVATPGVSIEWVDRADASVGSAGVPEDRASANAWSSFERALAITIDGDEIEDLALERSGLDGAPRAAHTIITAKKHSRGHIVLHNSGAALLAENVEIIVEDGADLTVVSVQQWNDDAIHLASHFARVGRDAKLRHVSVSLDGDVIRINPSVHLVSEGADVELYGAYFATTGQHIEQQVFVDHDAPKTKSRVTYKGALQGRGAHTVWIGDVLIRQSAAGTDSYEQNRNLLLTDGARADSIPNLEIETGDIAGAGHASASGRFDDEQLFYLQARGISEEEARRLVVRGFLAEIVQRIGSPELQKRLESAIESALVPEGAQS
ncbi:Fe-S cluster assembly protein SufD [Marisediminicola antarctica]|uniref:Fe-S cluster assembly protein SufD n=1 Tax=Marisediminicola antarctica TaxID=674079 RepID=A0A7L5AMT6_9MICO|nr:Fe-S cluster assembly protein SufD [Marisediminicola antarctica]